MCSSKHHKKNKLCNLHSTLKKQTLYDEAFYLSFLIAKYSTEQLQLYPQESSNKYRCSGCGEPYNPSELKTFSAQKLKESGLPEKHFKFKEPGADNKYYLCENCISALIKTKTCFVCEKDFLMRSENEYMMRDDLIVLDLPQEKYSILKEINTIKHSKIPVCNECFDEIDEKYICAVCTDSIEDEECFALRQGDIETYDVQNELSFRLIQPDSKYFICEYCWEKDIVEYCSDCVESFQVGLMSDKNAEGNKICDSCADNYSKCESCGNMISIEDEEYLIIDDSIYCENCRPENENQIEDIERNLHGSIGDGPASFPSVFIPLSKGSLNKVIKILTPIFNKYYKVGTRKLSAKKSKTVLDMLNRIKIEDNEKKFIIEYLFPKNAEESKTLDLIKLMMLMDSFDELSSIYMDIEGKYKTSRKTKKLKSYRPMNVDFDVNHPRDGSKYRSFVVVMLPSEEMYAASRAVFGEVGPYAFKLMSGEEYMGIAAAHHSGSISYARIGNYDGEWIIENLQRDADYYNLEKIIDRREERIANKFNINEVKKAGKWWDKITSNWALQMLLTITELANDTHTRLYLTPFSVQKSKWHNIPDKSRNAYDILPSEMMQARMDSISEDIEDEEEREVVMQELLFPRKEDYEGELEDDGYIRKELWRLAKKK